jgi:hypothetical protein
MNVIFTLALGLLFGTLACFQFGLVQQRIIQCVLHAKGLGSTAVAIGGSIPDFLFAGAGLILIDAIFSVEPALLYTFNFLVAAVLFGFGIYHLALRRYSPKVYGSSPGSYESIGTGFGLGLFNIGHVFYWLLVMYFLRGFGLLELSLKAQIGWFVGCWIGVLTGYLYTAKWVFNKQIGIVISRTSALSRILGGILIVMAIILGTKLLDQ